MKLTAQVPLWEKWNAKVLKNKEEEVGKREFARGWRQQPLATDDILFRPEHVEECIDSEAELYFPGQENTFRGTFPESYKCFMGVDLAIATKKSQGDFFCISIIVCDKTTRRKTLVGMFRDRGLTFSEQIRKIELWADYFDPNLIMVENNAYQEAIVQELKRKTDLPVKSFTTNAVNKNDLENGLPRMAVEFEKHNWTIPMMGEDERDLCGILINELTSYPIGRHDDTMMALWFARRAAIDSISYVSKRIFVV